MAGDSAIASFERLEARDSLVRLIDHTRPGSPNKIYRNVHLTASIEPGSPPRHISGVLSAHSGSEGSERLNLDAPFDLTLDRSGPAIALDGRIGPADVETPNFAAHQLTSSVNLRDRQLAFDQIDMKLYDGVMRGRVGFDLANDSFTATGALDHVDIDSSLTGKLRVPGEIKGHINAEFDLRGESGDLQRVFPTWKGAGSVSSNGLFMPRFNISEQIARALMINEIGEMSAGTSMTGVTGRFRLEEGLLSLDDLTVKNFDGLGQARIEHGWIRFSDEPVMDQTATITLSPETIEQISSASLLFGVIATLLQRENRIIVPVNVTGSLRNPNIRVDVDRFLRGGALIDDANQDEFARLSRRPRQQRQWRRLRRPSESGIAGGRSLRLQSRPQSSNADNSGPESLPRSEKRRESRGRPRSSRQAPVAPRHN
jgi:hypothetical protein